MSCVGNCLDNQVAGRACELLMVPHSAATESWDAILATAAAVGSIATLGLSSKFNGMVQRNTPAFGLLIARPYSYLLRTLNVEAEGVDSQWEGPAISYINRKFGSDRNWACKHSANVLEKHLASRLLYVLAGVASVIARLADLALGLVAAVFSFVTLGMVEEINDYAYRGLKGMGFVADILTYSIKVINPWAFDNRPGQRA